MVQVASLFNQLLQHFSRTEFAALVQKHKAERACKGFGCWTQFVAMLFCQLARTDSLREICNGLSCSVGKMAHLGIRLAPNKSTLAYANAHRPASFFEELFWTTLKRFRSQQQLGQRHHGFRFKNKLLSLDSTTVVLCLKLFPWAKFRTAKGGVKAHVLLDHDDYLPRYILMTPARQSDVQMAHRMPLNPGSIVVLDRGYIDYSLFARWCSEGVFFVVRARHDINSKVLQTQPIPKNRHILSDEIIQLDSRWGRAYCNYPLRLITVEQSDSDQPLLLLTNHLEFGATTISQIYRDRWQIEIFFKTLKQNLKIKTFVGTTENALLIQIWTALIALLLMRWLHFLSKAKWSLSNLASMLRLNLFTYRDLRCWLDDPFLTPPLQPSPMQLSLPVS
jgi:hypothetical protein